MTLSPFSLFMEATNATVVEHFEVPLRAERLSAPPKEFASGPPNEWLRAMMGGAEQPRLHQSIGLRMNPVSDEYRSVEA